VTIQPTALVGSASTASNRAHLATMLRDTGLDLLEALGVAVRHDAAFDPAQAVWSDPVSLVGFGGGEMAGTLIVSAPWPLMARTSPIADHRPEGLADWSRELSNMMLGGLKVALLRRGFELQMGLPASVVSSDMRITTSSRDPIGHRFDCGGLDLLAALDWLIAPGVVMPAATVAKAELALGHEFLLL
jgi:hypothetical protein